MKISQKIENGNRFKGLRNISSKSRLSQIFMKMATASKDFAKFLKNQNLAWQLEPFSTLDLGSPGIALFSLIYLINYFFQGHWKKRAHSVHFHHRLFFKGSEKNAPILFIFITDFFSRAVKKMRAFCSFSSPTFFQGHYKQFQKVFTNGFLVWFKPVELFCSFEQTGLANNPVSSDKQSLGQEIDDVGWFFDYLLNYEYFLIFKSVITVPLKLRTLRHHFS